jgi:hypothetical protein
LLAKFNGERISFPKIPNTFTNHDHYKKFWHFLIQYEIFSKLLSRSSNKRQKITIKEENGDDLEDNELENNASNEVQGKVDA